jgi:lysophospholipase L1-like esterase
MLAIMTFAVPSAAARPGTENKPPGITNGESALLNVMTGESVTLELQAKDPEKKAMTWEIPSQPQLGAATLSVWSNIKGTSKVTLTYKANKDPGTEVFTVLVKDEKDASDSIVISVTVSEPTPPPPPAEIRYVSLGDSIATGTTTPLTNPTNPYVNQFENYLRSTFNGTTIIRSAFETDGDRTNELLSKLQGNAAMRAAVQSADVITVSIGGNNLMQAAKTWYGYDFFNINTSVANQGFADFQSQWGTIMSTIRTLNPKAKIITMTIFNPYNLSDATLHNLVDGYLFRNGNGMNEMIMNGASEMHYGVADVFTAFDAYNTDMSRVTLLYPSSLLRNPHPNQNGQNLIFELHKQVYLAL